MKDREVSTLSGVLKKDGRTVIVAMDHGGFMGVAPGWENPGPVIEAVVKGGADAIMTTFGLLKKYGSLMEERVGLILSVPLLGDEMRNAARLAKSMRADCLKIFVVIGAEDEAANLASLWRSSLACHNEGVALLAEMFPVKGTKVQNPSDKEVVKKYARIAAEYGADMVKTFYTGSAESFKEVASTSLVPVVILGGEKTETDLDLLRAVEGSVKAGGAGVAMGRNVWQHKSPESITRAIARVVHDGYTAEKAAKEL